MKRVAKQVALVCCLALTAHTQGSRSYLLGPDDQLTIRVLDLDEMGGAPYRVDREGNIALPLVGTLAVAGRTVGAVEASLTERLKEYLQSPKVTVSITDFGSQPVTVLGSVNSPGVRQVRGHRTLFQVISEAGGLKTEAGNRIRITREKQQGPLPLAGASLEPSGQYFVGEVSVKAILDASNPGENIEMRPNDVVSVPRANLVYVIGAVKRTGGYVLTENDHLSVLEALSMSEGLERSASPGKAKILRAVPGAGRTEIAVNITKILNGKGSDVDLNAGDILFIPGSAIKSAALRSMETAIQFGTGIAIYRL